MAPTDKEEEQERLHSSCVDSDDDDDNYDEFDEVEDDEDEDANLRYHPICDPKGATFSSLREALQHDREVYGVDLLSVLPPASKPVDRAKISLRNGGMMSHRSPDHRFFQPP